MQRISQIGCKLVVTGIQFRKFLNTFLFETKNLPVSIFFDVTIFLAGTKSLHTTAQVNNTFWFKQIGCILNLNFFFQPSFSKINPGRSSQLYPCQFCPESAFKWQSVLYKHWVFKHFNDEIRLNIT